MPNSTPLSPSAHPNPSNPSNPSNTPTAVTVHIAGQPLKLLTDRDPAYLERLTQHIDQTLLAVQRSPQPRPSPQVLLLALLRLADELFEAQHHTSALKDLLQHRAESIIRLLDGAPPSSP